MANTEEFHALVGRLSGKMANRGVFFWPGWKRFLLTLIPLVLWSPAFQAVLIAIGWMDEWSWQWFWIGQLLYAVPMAMYVVATITFGRRSIQTHVYASFIGSALSDDRSVQRQAAKRTLGDFAESQVRHVLCATELTSGEPFYMDRHMVYSPIYGSGSCAMSIGEAVYASAAFPIGFPPLRVKTSQLDLSGGQMEERPRRLFLSDGGVFNNLGTDSFTAWDRLRDSPFGDEAGDFVPALPDRYIVVNASSPPALTNLTNVVAWRSLVATKRIMTVLYENTLRPRMQALLKQTQPDRAVVIDIADSPVELAKRMKTSENSDFVETVISELRRARTDSEWHAYAVRAASTPTVLSRIGETSAVRLLRLGYLGAAIACSIEFGTEGLADVPAEQWFKNLLRTDRQMTTPNRSPSQRNLDLDRR